MKKILLVIMLSAVFTNIIALNSRNETFSDFTLEEDYKKEVITIKNSNKKIVATISTTDFYALNPDNEGSPFIIGWSKDKKVIWFDTSAGSGIETIGKVNLDTNEWYVFKKPEFYNKSHQILINYENGDCLYSDYPALFEPPEYDVISEQMFTVYKYNFKTEISYALDTNYGAGFEFFLFHGKFYYKKIVLKKK